MKRPERSIARFERFGALRAVQPQSSCVGPRRLSERQLPTARWGRQPVNATSDPGTIGSTLRARYVRVFHLIFGNPGVSARLRKGALLRHRITTRPLDSSFGHRSCRGWPCSRPERRTRSTASRPLIVVRGPIDRFDKQTSGIHDERADRRIAFHLTLNLVDETGEGRVPDHSGAECAQKRRFEKHPKRLARAMRIIRSDGPDSCGEPDGGIPAAIDGRIAGLRRGRVGARTICRGLTGRARAFGRLRHPGCIQCREST